MLKQLRELIDTHPRQAIAKARKLETGTDLEFTKAAIFIEAGYALKDKEIIREGVMLIRHLLTVCPDNISLKYNLGNGLYYLALLEEPKVPSWHLKTKEKRLEARSLLSEVASNKNTNYKLATQAYTNLGNLLLSSYRWVEAYDAYHEALKKDQRNGVAAAGLVKILDRFISIGIGDTQDMCKVAHKYAMLAAQCDQQIREYAGLRSYQTIKDQIAKYLDGKKYSYETSALTLYQKFIKANRLHLSLTIEGASFSQKRWDSLTISAITEDINAEHEVPPIFAMMNMMKADYLAARWLAFTSLYHNKHPESGYYSDTLDYALYGMKYSLITHSQRVAFDILDKIAVAIADYLGFERPEKASFSSIWHRDKGEKLEENYCFPKKIQAEIEEGNIPLIALSEIADDLNENKYLYVKKEMRRSSTHRFTILHDELIGTYRNNRCISHFNIMDFEKGLIETLQLARASLIYFVEMIALHEARKNRESKPIIPLMVPSHHFVRGQD